MFPTRYCWKYISFLTILNSLFELGEKRGAYAI